VGGFRGFRGFREFRFLGRPDTDTEYLCLSKSAIYLRIVVHFICCRSVICLLTDVHWMLTDGYT